MCKACDEDQRREGKESNKIFLGLEKRVTLGGEITDVPVYV